MKHVLVLSLLLPSLACTSSPGGGSPSSSSSSSSSGSAVFSSSAFASSSSSVSAATSELRASSSEMGSASSGADPSCNYIDLDIFIVGCAQSDGGSGFEYMRRWVDTERSSCTPYFTLDGSQYATQEAALDGEMCNAACIWRAATSVSYLHCGVRNGYIIFRADGCDDVYEFDDGLYDSAEAYERNHPCN